MEAEPVPLIAVADPLIGCVVAERYHIVDVIGRGAMGVVYAVEHVHIGKLMAMKLLRGDVAHRHEVVERFAREARAASVLKHPSTVQVFDFGHSDGLSYLVMEYVEGEDIGTILDRDGPFDFGRAARLALQLCGSLAEAHAAGIVHRDIKPTNLLVTSDPEGGERIKVADFGLAQLRSSPGMKKLTTEGMIVGTPYFIAPEQIQGDEVDGRADIYSIGAVLFRAVVGEPPFVGPGSVAVLAQHLQQQPRIPSAVVRGLPAVADRIILKCLEKNPADRYATVSELKRELERVVADLSQPTITPKAAAQPRRNRSVPSLPSATRRDIVGFEQARRRQSRLRRVLLTLFSLVLLVGLGVGGLVLSPATAKRLGVSELLPSMGTAEPVDEGRERERNDSAPQAHRLALGQPIRGQIGKRLGPTKGDVDFFRVELPRGKGVRLTITLHGLPNMDLVLRLFPGIASRPLITADEGGIGAGERIEVDVDSSGPYYISVEEQKPLGATPSENISDEYLLEISAQTPSAEVTGP